MPDRPAPDRVVVVGASLAGLRAAEGLRQAGHTGPITVVGEEPVPPYDRPPLSKQVLTGKIALEDTALGLADSLQLEWVLGTAATGLDLEGRRVRLQDGSDLGFDGLVIATGARPRILPGAPPGPGVHYLRTAEDARRLAADLSRSSAAVVIGAGFIGLEVACSATTLGVPVVVLEALPVPLERAVGPDMGRAIMEWHRRKGMDIRVGVGVEGVEGTGRPEGVRLRDGSVVPADTVVVGVGVAPATEWLRGSGVDLDDGVVCDQSLRVLSSGRPLAGVVAAGDVARWAHPDYDGTVRVEHWTNAAESGEAAARSLLQGAEAEPYAPVPYFWSDQHGVKIQFVGQVTAGDELAFLEDNFDGDRVVAAFGRDGRLVGGLGIRRPARIMELQRLIREGAAFPPEL